LKACTTLRAAMMYQNNSSRAGTPSLFNSMTHQRQAVDEADPIRPGVSFSLGPQVIQKLRRRFNARDKQMIPRTHAGDVEQVALGVIDQVSIIIGSYSW
jgi:hypothetical protein